MVIKFFKTTFYFILIILALIVCENSLLAQGSATVVINEFLYNPDGTDTGYEWIELYNPTSQDISLAGWKIEIAGTVFQSSVEIADLTIQPDSYLLICGDQVASTCDLVANKIGMQNGGSSSDGVRLMDSDGNIVDVVIYDLPNTNNLQDESGIVVSENMTSVTALSGESLGRKNGIDTENSREDFIAYASPTPGEKNLELELEEEVLGESDVTAELEDTGYNHLMISLVVVIFISFILVQYSDILFH